MELKEFHKAAYAALSSYVNNIAQRDMGRVSDTERCRIAKETGRYSYIPWGSGEFLRCLGNAVELFKGRYGKKPQTFLEIGCGYGHMTGLAYTASRASYPGAPWTTLDCSGMDINEKYIKHAQKTHRGCEFFVDDALEFDRYGEYDLLYFYMPFYDRDMGDAFVARVLSQAEGKSVVFGSTTGVRSKRVTYHDRDVRGGFAIAPEPEGVLLS